MVLFLPVAVAPAEAPAVWGSAAGTIGSSATLTPVVGMLSTWNWAVLPSPRVDAAAHTNHADYSRMI